MKNIYEILKALGIEVPEDKKTEFDKEVAANYRTITDYEKQGDKLKLAEEKVKATADALQKFDGVDVDALKQQAAELQTALDAKDAEYQQKISEMEFDGLLSAAITGAKGKNAKAVRGLLDLDTLKASKNQSEDIKAALAALKESDGYLFDDAPTPPPYAAGTGSAKIENVTKEQFAKMGYRELLELKKSNPEQYEALKE